MLSILHNLGHFVKKNQNFSPCANVMEAQPENVRIIYNKIKIHFIVPGCAILCVGL